MAITIRSASLVDLEALLSMGERFVADTSYRDHLSLSMNAVSALASQLIGGPQSEIFVADAAGSPVGMLGAVVFTHPMSGQRTAGEMFWWVEPSFRGAGIGLLREFLRWGKSQGADVVQMVAPTEDIARIYQRFGFAEVERTFQRRT